MVIPIRQTFGGQTGVGNQWKVNIWFRLSALSLCLAVGHSCGCSDPNANPAVQELRQAGGVVDFNQRAQGNPATVNLHGKSFTDATIAPLARLENVAILSLQDSQITDSGLTAICKHASIKWLNLSGTQITNRGLKSLGPLRQLEKLSLNGLAEITDDGLQALTELPELNELSLNGTGITDDGLEYLSRIRRLRQLSVKGTGITGAGFKDFSSSKSLSMLTLGGENINADGISAVAKIPYLRMLHLEHCPNVNDAAILNIDAKTPISLMFLKETAVTATGLELLGRRKPDLQIHANLDSPFNPAPVLD
jgi:hypothetical protein